MENADAMDKVLILYTNKDGGGGILNNKDLTLSEAVYMLEYSKLALMTEKEGS